MSCNRHQLLQNYIYYQGTNEVLFSNDNENKKFELANLLLKKEFPLNFRDLIKLKIKEYIKNYSQNTLLYYRQCYI